MLLDWAGFLLLFALTAFAAVAVAVRAEPSGRAELAVIAALVFFALTATPTLLLGYSNHLTPALLAVASTVTSATALLLASRRAVVFGHLKALARLPFDSLLEAARARSAIVIGLAWSAGLIALALWLTYIAPSESWDGHFYHEPMVGFAIQNHGFAAVPLPQHQAVQATNGYARLGEAVSLWFVIFTDKTLVELPNTIAAPPLLLALYLMTRRTLDRLSAAAWSPVLLMIPALWTEMRSTMIDLEVGLFTISAIHFITRPDYRIRDAMWATLAMALFAAAKLSALAWVPPMALIAYGRLLVKHAHGRWWSAVAASVCGSLVIAGMGSLTLVHNWHAFHNPVWPMTVDSAALGIHWTGLNTLQELGPHVSLKEWVQTKYGAPIGGMPDMHDRDYGYAVTWIVIPFALVGVLRVLRGAAREIRERRLRESCNLLFVLAIGLLSMAVTPTMFPGRYNYHIVAVWIVAASAGVAGSRWKRAREGVIVAAIAMSIVPLQWTRGWYFAMDVSRFGVLARHSFAERRWMNSEAFDIPERVAKLREEELGPGDRVAFTQEIITPGALWNYEFSNVVGMVAFENPHQFFASLAAFDPKWLVVTDKGAARAALDRRPNEWEYIGPGTAIDDGAIFRRRR